MAYDKSVKATKKNSPAVHTGKAKFNKPADTYAAPHTNKEARITGQEVMDRGVYAREKAAKDITINDPIKGGVSYGTAVEKTDGIEMRGAGAATKGRMSRGPMA